MNLELAAAKVCKRTRMLEMDTQSDLALYCNCSPENIAKFERGDNNNLRLFLLYAYRYNISIDEIVKEALKNG